MKASVEMESLAPHSLAEEIYSLYEQWDRGRSEWAKRIAEVRQYVYATSTRETSNVANNWSHSTVIPKLTQIHDNLGANYSSALFSRREFFTFEPAAIDEASVKKRQAIVNYLRTKHDYNGYFGVMKQLLNDWAQTGNCFCRVEYVVEKEKNAKTEEEYTVYEGPKLIRISPEDIVFNPRVKHFKDSPKIFRETLTRGELIRKSRSPAGSEFDPEVLAKVRSIRTAVAGMSRGQAAKNLQMRYDGFTNPEDYFNSGTVELLHFVGDIYDKETDELHENRMITVVDRRWVLQDSCLTDYQGWGRIYHAGWRKRPDNLWAQGPLDNLVGMQYLINHLENARADGFDQILTPDRVHRGQVEIEREGPVTNYYVDDANGDVSNLAPDTTILNADNQIALKEAQMEAYAGAPREAMGIRSPGEKTAFEVQQLQNAASRLFQTRIEDFEEQIIEPTLNGELEVAVLNLDHNDIARVLDEDFGVTEFITITVEDLQAKGKLKARGASHFAKRAQLVQELQGFGQVLAGDPAMAVHFPAKARAKAWNDALGFDVLELYSPYGQIEENLEAQKQQEAANQAGAEFTAAGELNEQAAEELDAGRP